MRKKSMLFLLVLSLMLSLLSFTVVSAQETSTEDLVEIESMVSEDAAFSVLALWQKTTGNPAPGYRNNVICILKLQVLQDLWKVEGEMSITTTTGSYVQPFTFLGSFAENKSFADMNWLKADILWAKGYSAGSGILDFTDIPLWHMVRAPYDATPPIPPGFEDCV